MVRDFGECQAGLAETPYEVRLEAGHCSQPAQAVYRYDFQTGALTWVSHQAGASLAAPNEGKDAIISPLPGAELGGNVNVDDWNRAAPTSDGRSGELVSGPITGPITGPAAE